jgi:hypothetical protein
MTVNSTLVLIDGHRAINYPLADDGQRTFVDLNTIPTYHQADIIGRYFRIGARYTFQPPPCPARFPPH